MAITKAKKQEIVAKAENIFSDAESVVFVNFHGLSITDEQAMRNKLKDEGVNYYVAKKRLIGRALDGAKYEGERPAFEGELAVAYSQDPVAPAREVYEFVKKSDGALAIRGGVFEGVYKNAEEMTEIAKIPGLQQLRGMFVNVINSPIQGMVIALQAIADNKQNNEATA